MDTEAATTVLTIVGMSFGTIMAALITLMVTSIRLQHKDSTLTRNETRELIGEVRKENRELIKETRKETRDLIDKNRELIEKNRDLIERNHGVVIRILGDTRERLARIEGHLGIGLPTNDGPETDGNNREAA